MRKSVLASAVLMLLAGCVPSWTMFRFNQLRSGIQPLNGPLLYASNVARLRPVAIAFPPGAERFRASPIVVDGKVFIGNANGFFYAFRADNLQLLWQYPRPNDPSQPPLRSRFANVCGAGGHTVVSHYGISSSAVFTQVRDPRTGRWRDAIVFAAPDPTMPPGLGSGVLIALDPQTGALIRKSDVLARLTGLNAHIPPPLQYHEQLGYSSPLVMGDRIYVGVADHCDNPVQKGRVVAVDRGTLATIPAFSFCAVGTCDRDDRWLGGGVWSTLAGWRGGVYATTGNVRNSGQTPAPVPNHGLSTVRLHETTGAIQGKIQPVPWELDDDPDWAAGVVVAPNVCRDGHDVLLSTMKDGYSYAINVGPNGNLRVRWVFPPATVPFRPGDGTVHPDTQYKRPGLVTYDYYVTTSAGWNAVLGNLRAGYARLYAYNICATSVRDRVRWILDVPADALSHECRTLPMWRRGTDIYEGTGRNCLGPPTATGSIVFVGTQGGHLVAAADPYRTGLASGVRCSNPDIHISMCQFLNGHSLVLAPQVVLNLDLRFGAILTEPVIVGDSVYVATDLGRVVRLQPR